MFTRWRAAFSQAHWQSAFGRSTALLLALVLLGVALVMPQVKLMRDAFDYVVVFDITQSMNVRDYSLDGRVVSRLDYARETMRRQLRELPCGSKIGWGVFAEYRTLVLLAPIEVCENYGDLLATLARIDGNLRWADASEISKGVFWALRAVKELGTGAGLVFLTDGHEAPPLTHDLPLFDDIKPGQIPGWLIGVGGAVPMPIPRTNVDGQPIGYWGPEDVVQRVGRSEAGAQLHEHLSELREPHLQALARQVGLQYAALRGPQTLAGVLQDPRFAHRAPVPTDLSVLPLAGAFALLLFHFRPAGGVAWLRRRRRALVAGFAAVLALFGATRAASQPSPQPQPQPTPLVLQPDRIAAGVYAFTGTIAAWGEGHHGDVSNSGFIVGERCIAMVDSGGSPTVGRALLAAVRRVSRLPVCYVVTTHVHPDHLMGNSALAQANQDVPGAGPPSFVGHARLAAALAARQAFFLKAMQRDFDAADVATTIPPPDRTVQDTLALDLGGRTISLRAWPTAHTDNDVTVLDAQTGTLFLGDLAFVDHLPVVDGSLAGWLGVLQSLQTLPEFQPVVRAVPGHGPLIGDWPAGLAPTQRYLTQLQADVRDALRHHQSLSQTVDRLGAQVPPVLPGRPPWQLVDEFHRRNVTAAYAELEWAE